MAVTNERTDTADMKNIYVAACAPDGGVYLCDFENEKLSVREFYPFDSPMFLAKSGDKMYIELRKTDGENSGILECNIAPDGTLSNFGAPVSTKGIVACHLCVHDSDVYCVNYLSGSVSRIRNGVCDKLDVHTGHGPHPTRQEAAHTHYINVTPDGKYLVSTDLGLDTVYIYDFDLGVHSTAKVPDGHGCRHVVFNHEGTRMYCVNELASTVTVFIYSDGTLVPLGTYPALPPDYDGVSTAAAIRISDDGKYLYVSNRGHDSITCFEITDSDTLEIRSYTPCGGKRPRDFDIKDGYLFSTNEETNDVTVFRCEGPKLTLLDTKIDAEGALCVIFG